MIDFKKAEKGIFDDSDIDELDAMIVDIRNKDWSERVKGSELAIGKIEKRRNTINKLLENPPK